MNHIKKVWENKFFCGVLILDEKKILELVQYLKSTKAPSLNYADLESLIKKSDECKNNLENSFTTKIPEHIACGYSMSTICAFDDIKNRHGFYKEIAWQSFVNP